MSKSLTDFWIPTTSTHQRVLAAPAWGWSFWETSPVFLRSHLLPFVPCHRLIQDLRQKWSKLLTFQRCTWWLLTEINVSTWEPTLPLTQQHTTDRLLRLQLGWGRGRRTDVKILRLICWINRISRDCIQLKITLNSIYLRLVNFFSCVIKARDDADIPDADFAFVSSIRNTFDWIRCL